MAGGLSLLLNIEQYEYMPGPNSGAGLKLSIHRHNDTPEVDNQGIAIQPGAHGYVDLRVIQVGVKVIIFWLISRFY